MQRYFLQAFSVSTVSAQAPYDPTTSTRQGTKTGQHDQMLALVNITSSSFPESPGSLFSENLPETVYQATVGGLTGTCRHL